MAKVYSDRLFAGLSLGGGSPDTISGPPAGTRWVLRHMTAIFNGGAGAKGFVLQIASVGVLWSMGPFNVYGDLTYDWSGRQVVQPGEELLFTSLDGASWGLLASGYALVLP